MNDHYYHSHIKHYIEITKRKIISKKDMWLLGIYKLQNNSYKMLLTNIVIHTGSPCYRYCTCHFFNNKDKIAYYDSIRCH